MEDTQMDEKTTEVKNLKSQKSKIIAYFLWLFGGFFGLHLLYLERDKHALVHITTLGGYFGIGWCRDFFKIPTYVDDANNDPTFVEIFKIQVKANKKVDFFYATHTECKFN